MEVSELQSSINALRRQNWSQLPDRAPLDLVDPVLVVPAASSTSPPVAGANSTSTATTSTTPANSTTSRTSGNSNCKNRSGVGGFEGSGRRGRGEGSGEFRHQRLSTPSPTPPLCEKKSHRIFAWTPLGSSGGPDPWTPPACYAAA